MRLAFYSFLTVLICCFGCQNSCQNKKAEQENKEVSKELAAKVGEVGISLVQLAKDQDRVINNFKRANRPVAPAMVLSLRGEILKKLIDNELIKKRAAELNLSLDRIERVAALDQFKERLGGPQNFQAYLDNQDISEEEMINNIVTEKLKEKIIIKEKSIKDPTEDEIATFYRENPAMFGRPETVRAKHVLLKLSAKDPAEKQKEVQEKAQKIYAEAKGGRPFEQLVSSYSESPSKERGGDLGYMTRGRMVKTFEEPIFNAQPGDIVGPLRTEFGYHIVLVEEKTQAQLLSLADARPRVLDILRMEQTSKEGEEVISALRQKANIEIFDSSLSKEAYLGPAKEAMR